MGRMMRRRRRTYERSSFFLVGFISQTVTDAAAETEQDEEGTEDGQSDVSILIDNIRIKEKERERIKRER